MNQRIQKILLTLGICIGILLLVFILFRNSLLQWGIRKSASKVNQSTGATLVIKSASFSGLNSVAFHEISITPVTGDTLLAADSVNLTISVWALLGGTLRLTELYVADARINLSCSDSICNYSGFIHRQNRSVTTSGKNYALFLKGIFDKTFNLAPQRATFHNVSLIYENETLRRNYKVEEFFSDEKSMEGTFLDEHSGKIWKCTGKFSQRQHSIDFTIFPSDGNRSLLPLISELTGITVGFDTIHLSMANYNGTRSSFSTHGSFSVNQLVVFHPKISGDSVKIPAASIDFSLHAGKTFIELDSNSLVTVSAIRMRPYMSLNTTSGKEYTVNMRTDKINSTDFFASLPAGVFDEVQDIEASGTLQFEMNFKINSLQPDSVFFQAGLKKENFKLKKYGSVELLKMNSEFTQNVYEKERFIRSIDVGPANPNFTPLDSISKSFVNAVLTSEDGNFFYHNGFNEDAFRKSIAANFKAGKFVRGGSTISMQLVKNIFLNRKKTIARKAEEALLVWLIENNRLCSKERMLEVYLNIIELGPDVYGIGEASGFYFNKRASQLNLAESIFLASLLPHPKWFKYSFDTLGNLKPALASYYKVVSDFMLRKNLITQEERDQLILHIDLNGPAREMVVPTDSIPEEEDDL